MKITLSADHTVQVSGSTLRCTLPVLTSFFVAAANFSRGTAGQHRPPGEDGKLRVGERETWIVNHQAAKIHDPLPTQIPRPTLTNDWTI